MRILMVCLGNICRSPLAEGLLRKHGKGLKLELDSAGTSSQHEGEAPDPRTRKNAIKNGLNIDMLRSRPFNKSDFQRFDKIFVMDKDNLRNVLNKADNEQDRGKVSLLLEEVFPGSDAEVPDPWFGGEECFQQVFEMLDEACRKLAEKIREQNIS